MVGTELYARLLNYGDKVSSIHFSLMERLSNMMNKPIVWGRTRGEEGEGHKEGGTLMDNP